MRFYILEVLYLPGNYRWKRWILAGKINSIDCAKGFVLQEHTVTCRLQGLQVQT